MAEEMALFSLDWGVGPTEYLSLSRLQKQAFYEQMERINNRRK
jgi:hypothetical protein